MSEREVRERAFAMPLTNPAYLEDVTLGLGKVVHDYLR